MTTLSAVTVISAAIATDHPATKNGALQTAPAIALQRLPFFQQRSVFSLDFFDASNAASMHLPCGLRVYELIFQENLGNKTVYKRLVILLIPKKIYQFLLKKHFFPNIIYYIFTRRIVTMAQPVPPQQFRPEEG